MQQRNTPARWLQSRIVAGPAGRVFWCVFAGFIATANVVDAATLRVAWDATTDPAVAGYRVSMGTQSRHYTVVLDVGAQTIAQFDNLTAGATYYFAVQAYDRAGNTSDYSNEVAAVAPLTSALAIMCPVLTVTSPSGAPVVVAFTPVVSGGSSPVSIVCSPPSSSLFALGATPVLCIARDAAGASASCATAVVVIASR